MAADGFTAKPVTEATWPDLEALFGAGIQACRAGRLAAAPGAQGGVIFPGGTVGAAAAGD